MKKIGAGEHATVYTTETGTVRKIVRNVGDLTKDAYFQFINEITENEQLSNNPYLPKIFHVQVEGNSYTVEMERLDEWDTLSDEEALTIGRQLISGFDQNKERFVNSLCAIMWYLREMQRNDPLMPLVDEDEVIKSLEDSQMYPPGTDLHEVMMSAGKQLREQIHQQFVDNIKDPTLLLALEFIQEILHRQSSFFSDSHEENIMVRRGEHSPQLVFTDPIAQD